MWLICFTLLPAMPTWTQAQTEDCSNLSPVPLVVGEFGQVSSGQSNNVRDTPSRDGTRLGLLEGGEQFAVIDGPVCADDLVWWQIQAGILVGWTVDGSEGEQWLIPITELISDAKPPVVLSTTPITPENATALQPLRNVSCENGSEFSATIALGSRYLAVNCGFYNMNMPNIDSRQKMLLHDRLGIIDLESGQHVMTLSEEENSVLPLAFVSDDRLLWFSYETQKSPVILHLSDVTSGEEIATVEIDGQDHSQRISGPIFYANNTRFALFFKDDDEYVLHHWDATTLTPLKKEFFDMPEASVRDMSFAISEDGKRFVIIYEGEDRTKLAIYTSKNRQPDAVISVPFVVFNNSTYLRFSPSGYFVVGIGCRTETVACGNPALYWWNTADGTQVAEWEVPLERSGPLRFSPDGKLLVMGTTSGAILYAVDSGEVVYSLPADASKAIFSSDGTYIVTQGDPLTTIWTVGQ